MSIPVKPFPSYKWRWLSFTPSEGLLKVPVFLGVLRALEKFEGKSFISVGLHKELKLVKRDTNTSINLARTPDRNLFRNSGQYWRGTGLISSLKGKIELTNLGRSVSSGQITSDEFAALMIRNTVLPNPATYTDMEMMKWKDARLRLKPFELILSVMDKLGRSKDFSEAFLTLDELVRVVIPLAGAKASVEDMAISVFKFRNGRLDTSSWPNCVPAANDKRFANEFLIFLENFGICRVCSNKKKGERKFYLNQAMSAEIKIDGEPSFLENFTRVDEEVQIARESEIPIIIERARVATSALRRTNQSKFRRDVLKVGNHQCILTQERILDVLEAAHIVPVGQGGTDLVGNGMCMRADIHRLYDGGKIRIEPSGAVTLNDQIKSSVSYARLPRMINFPKAILKANLKWRSRYL